MKKNYNIPAIEVVTLASGMIMLGGSPVQDPANPNNNNPDPNAGLIP